MQSSVYKLVHWIPLVLMSIAAVYILAGTEVYGVEG